MQSQNKEIKISLEFRENNSPDSKERLNQFFRFILNKIDKKILDKRNKIV